MLSTVDLVLFQLLDELFGTNALFPNTNANRLVASAVCSHYPLGSYLCQEAAFLVAGRHFFECNVVSDAISISDWLATFRRNESRDPTAPEFVTCL
jgi:hypothetical protein